MHFIPYWVCITYFYSVGMHMHNISKNGVHGVRRNYTPKQCEIHTFVLTVCMLAYIYIYIYIYILRELEVTEIRYALFWFSVASYAHNYGV